MWRMELLDMATDLYLLYDECVENDPNDALINQLEECIRGCDEVTGSQQMKALGQRVEGLLAQFPELRHGEAGLQLHRKRACRDEVTQEIYPVDLDKDQNASILVE